MRRLHIVFRVEAQCDAAHGVGFGIGGTCTELLQMRRAFQRKPLLKRVAKQIVQAQRTRGRVEDLDQ